MKNIGNFLGNGMGLFVKKLYNLVFNRIKHAIADFVQATPVESVKLFYGFCFISCLISIGSAGFIILPLGAVISISQLLSPEVNKIEFIGNWMIRIGAIYMVLSVSVIGIIGAVIYIKMKALSEKVTKKIN